MTLGADRTLRWTQPAAGSFPVVIRADNGRAVADQQFSLAVTTSTQPLELGLTVTPVLATTGQAVAISAYANGGRGTVTLQASVNAQPVTLNASGIGSFIAGPAGAYRVIVRATDANETLERQAVFTVGNATDTTEPTALITTPTADAEVMTSVDIIGTATDANLAYYQLLLRPAGATDADWKELARGNTNIANATLGRLNPTGLTNGAYELALRVVDINNRIKSTVVPIEIARDLKLGQFRLSFADIRADARGLPLMLTRTYDSTKREVNGDFGWGWSASSQDVMIRKNVVLGQQWSVLAQGLELCIRPSGQRRVTLTLPDGGVYRFRAKNLSECAFGAAPPLSIVFDALPLPVGGGSGRGGAGGQLEVSQLAAQRTSAAAPVAPLATHARSCSARYASPCSSMK